MKLKLLILTLLLATSVYAATYKVNPGGSVTSPKGKQTNAYNNYYSQPYVNNRTVNTGNIKNIEIVMDFSGSMTSWVKEAKTTMSKILSQIPQNTYVGFRVFGQELTSADARSTQANVSNIQKQGSSYVVKTEAQENKTGCTATKQVARITPVNYTNLINGMNSVRLGGSTPLVLALQKTVYNDFTSLPMSEPKKIVLITDGGENCGGDPCAFARNLNRNDVQIDVVLVSSNSRALMCLSQETGGNFYTINNISDFSTTLTRSMTTTKQETPQQSYEFVND